MNIIWLIITSLIYIIFLIGIYFSKPRLKSAPNTIFKILMVTNMLGLVIELCSFYSIINLPNTFYNEIITKSLQVYYIFFNIAFTLYVIVSSSHKEQSNHELIIYSFIMFFFFIICAVLVYILPIYYVNSNNMLYCYGPAVNLVYVIYILVNLVCLLEMIINFKTLKSGKFLPILTFIILSTIGGYIEIKNPELLFNTPIETLIVYLMYFTIENPDLKMLDELNKTRLSLVKVNNAKNSFITNISHDIRTPLNSIIGLSSSLKDDNDIKTMKEDINDLYNASNNLLDIVDSLSSISKIDNNEVKIGYTSYNFRILFNDLVGYVNDNNINNIKFTYDIESSLPMAIYGDKGIITEAIENILNMALKDLKEGYLSLQVNSLKQDNIIRLIITIEYSALNNNDDLEDTKLLINKIKGNIVKQTLDNKTKYTIIFDQEINNALNNNDNNLEMVKLVNHQKIMIVDDNQLNLKVTNKLLKDIDADITSVSSGNKCLELVKTNHYDLIIMDDMMPNLSGVETFNLLKQIPHFTTPVVILTANAMENDKAKYLQLGFSDYLAKPIEKSKLIVIINKYLNK